MLLALHATMISNEKCLDSISDINSYVGNLTASYTDKSNEPNMVAASVIMFMKGIG
jgi:hypothetical protein